MKTPRLLTITLLVTCMAFAGCANFGQKFSTFMQNPFVVGANKALLTLTQTGVDIAMQVILLKAQSSTDLTNKGNLLDSAAYGLRSLQGTTSNLVTPDIVVSTVRQFTSPSVYHWSDLADQLAAAFAKTQAAPDAKLEALAVAANDAAAKARAQAALAIPAADGKAVVLP